MMRSKKIFRKAMSVFMALAMSASTVFPVFADPVENGGTESMVDPASLEDTDEMSESEEGINEGRGKTP